MKRIALLLATLLLAGSLGMAKQDPTSVNGWPAKTVSCHTHNSTHGQTRTCGMMIEVDNARSIAGAVRQGTPAADPYSLFVLRLGRARADANHHRVGPWKIVEETCGYYHCLGWGAYTRKSYLTPWFDPCSAFRPSRPLTLRTMFHVEFKYMLPGNGNIFDENTADWWITCTV